MNPYNGFSGAYRDKVGRWMNGMFDSGRWVRPTVCELCDRGDRRIQAHLEDYDRPESWVGLCIRCHMALHNRARYPARWNGLIAEMDAEKKGLGSRIIHMIAATTPPQYRTEPPLDLWTVLPPSPIES